MAWAVLAWLQLPKALTFPQADVEKRYKEHLGRKCLGTFRYCYGFSFFVLIMKLCAMFLIQEEIGMDARMFLSVTLTGCCFLTSAITFSFHERMFLKLYYQVNFLLFFILGFIPILLSNAVEDFQNYLIIAEFLLLVFPFVLLTRIDFRVSCVGGVCIIVFFLIFRTWKMFGASLEVTKLISIALYLSLAITSLTIISFWTEKIERYTFLILIDLEKQNSRSRVGSSQDLSRFENSSLLLENRSMSSDENVNMYVY